MPHVSHYLLAYQNRLYCSLATLKCILLFYDITVLKIIEEKSYVPWMENLSQRGYT